MNQNFYIPTKGAQSWQELLAEPEKHWKTGCSAKTLANCWEDNRGFPVEFKKTFEQSGLIDIEFLLAIPEYKVELDNDTRPSQNDIFVLAKDIDGLIVIMVEGKVEEPFDKTIKDWNKNNSEGKTKRFEYLLRQLGLNTDENYDEYYYQLFHRTVCAIKTAMKFGAKKTMMIVHSFSKDSTHFDEYKTFAKLLKPQKDIKYDEIVRCEPIGDIELYLGWITGDRDYLDF